MSFQGLPPVRVGAFALALAFAAFAPSPASAQFGQGQGGRFERDDRGQGRVERRGRGDETVQGMSRERLARIGPVMNEQIDRAMFPGAVTLIARQGRIVHFEAHGFRDATKTQPMTRDTLFMLASMTKPIVSTAAVMLIEQGRMKLSDPIATWLTELKDMKVQVERRNADGTTTTEDVALARPITVQDLLRHTSGFTYAGSERSARIKQLLTDQNIEARTANCCARRRCSCSLR